MKILGLRREKGKRNRWLVHLEDGRSLSLTGDTVKKYGLRGGSEIEEDRVLTVQTEDDWQSALDKSIELLSYRDHSRREMSGKLVQKGYSDDLAAKVCDYLEERGYIDDAQFASRFCQELLNTRHIGPIQIRSKLIQRGIAAALVEDLLAKISADDILRHCQIQYDQKIRKLSKSSSAAERRDKMYRFLTQKGFAWDSISEIFRSNGLGSGEGGELS